MEEKEEIKVRLGTVISISIILLLLLGIGYLVYNNLKLQSDIENLNAEKHQITEELNTIKNSQLSNGNVDTTDENNTTISTPNLTVEAPVGYNMVRIFIDNGKVYSNMYDDGENELIFNVGDAKTPIAKTIRYLPTENPTVLVVTETGLLFIATSESLNTSMQLDWFSPYYQYKISDIIVGEQTTPNKYNVSYPVIKFTIILQNGERIETDTYEMFKLWEAGGE